MRRTIQILVTLIAAAISLLPYEPGPDPRVTGAPGDNPTACLKSGCHSGTFNSGSGGVKIILPGGQVYAPGVKQRVQVQISDPLRQKFGFQLTARLASNPANGQAGDLTPADNLTQVICDDNGTKPCLPSAAVQFIEHNIEGYKASTKESYTYVFDWTPPTTNAGPVTLYAAGNGVSGALIQTSANVYTTSVTLTPAVDLPAPVVTSVVNGATFQAAALAPDTYLTIKGTNLAGTTRTWAAGDFNAGKLPTSLDGVSVSLNGTAAAVEYVSPVQLNIIAPTGVTGNAVPLTVTVNGKTSATFPVNLQATAPSFFLYQPGTADDLRYVIAARVDGSLAGKTGLFPAAPQATTPAKRGETILLFGTGFGATSPVIAPGIVTDKVYNLSPAPNITIGGVTAQVGFAGLVPPYALFYQFNVTVPLSAPTGDQPLVATLNGVSSSAVLLTLQ